MRVAARCLTLSAVASVACGSPAFAADTAPVTVPGAAAANPPSNDFAMPPELVQKLSPEQILAVLRERETTRRPHVLGTLAFFGTLACAVLLSQIYATRRERLRQETLRAMIDKGMDVPRDLIAKRRSPVCDLRRGLVLIGAGVGLSVLFALVHLEGERGSGLWSVGLIPILMGVGFLAVWRIDSKNASAD